MTMIPMSSTTSSLIDEFDISDQIKNDTVDIKTVHQLLKNVKNTLRSIEINKNEYLQLNKFIRTCDHELNRPKKYVNTNTIASATGYLIYAVDEVDIDQNEKEDIQIDLIRMLAIIDKYDGNGIETNIVKRKNRIDLNRIYKA